MRLIDADEFMGSLLSIPNKGTDTFPIDLIIDGLDEQPTAYNVDKVVENLEHNCDKYINDCEVEWLQKENALKIVKEGVMHGID